MEKWRRTAARITLSYLVFGSLWVLVSDGLAQWTFEGSQWFARLQIIKGLAYVVVTTAFLWVLLNIFLRRLHRSEQAAAGFQQKLGILTQQSSEGVAVARDGRVLWANRAFGELLSLSADPLPGTQVDELPLEPPIPPDSDGHVTYDASRVGPEGRRVDLEVSVDEVTFGRRPARQITVRDITERKQAERGLRETQKRYRRISENIYELFFETSRSGTILEVSPSVQKVLGYEPDEVLGHSIQQYYVDEERRRELINLLEEQEAVSEWELNLVNAGGEPVPCAVNATLIDDEEAGEQRVVGTLRNISERRGLERRLQQAQRMESLGQLAGGVAHDFNNMLSAILGYVDLARRELDDHPEVREDLKQALEAGRRAEQLTRQLLAFSRRQVLDPEVIRVTDLINGLVKMLERVISEQIDLVVDMQDDLPPVFMDPGGLEQVLMNLILNARDAMPEGGTLTIGVERVDSEEPRPCVVGQIPVGSYVRLMVADTGVGMTPETVTRIFEPFFTTREAGTGLGLATVYGTVRQSGGYVCVESSPGQGSTFYVYLPRTERTLSERRPGRPEEQLTGGGETIMVVDDEEAVRAVARRILSSAGYVVLEASNGIEALRNIEDYSGGIDLVLTDVVMPQMGGAEFARALQERQADIRVVFMSGYPGESLPPKLGGELDGRPLAKPFTANELLPHVRAALDAPAP